MQRNENTFIGNLKSKITVTKNVADERARLHHMHIQQHQIVFVKKTDSADLLYNTHAANLEDVNLYIRDYLIQKQATVAELDDIRDRSYCVRNDSDGMITRTVLCWRPWGVNMSDVLRTEGSGFNSQHFGGPTTRDLVCEFAGKQNVQGNDIINVRELTSGAVLYIEIHWVPFVAPKWVGDIKNGCKYIFVPQFQLRGYNINQIAPSIQSYPHFADLDGEYKLMYDVLRWEFGQVFFNYNYKNYRERQVVAYTPTNPFHNQASVECILHNPLFCFFSEVPQPMEFDIDFFTCLL